MITLAHENEKLQKNRQNFSCFATTDDEDDKHKSRLSDEYDEKDEEEIDNALFDLAYDKEFDTEEYIAEHE